MHRKGMETRQRDTSCGWPTGNFPEEELDGLREGFSELGERAVRQPESALIWVAWRGDRKPGQGSEVVKWGKDVWGEITWLEGKGEPVHGPMRALVNKEFKDVDHFLPVEGDQ